MKLLFISLMEGSTWGGSEELWYRAAQAALKQHTVTVCVFHWDHEPAPIGRLRKLGAAIVKVQRRAAYPLLKRVRTRFLGEGHVQGFNDLKAFDPDAICVSQGGTFDLGYHAAFYELITGMAKPFLIVSQHNLEHGGIVPAVFRNPIMDALQKASHVFFVAARNRAVAERQLAAAIPNASIISNPVNIASIGIRPFPPTNTSLKMACVARLDCGYKGQDLLMEALSSTEWRNRDFLLQLFGAGPDESYLKQLIEFYGLGNKVYLAGKTADIDRVWEEHHVLVLPSLSEGTPLSMVEAMLCGRPVLAADVGGIDQYIETGKTGFLVATASVKALRSALEDLWEQRNQLEQLGINAYHHALAIVDRNPEQTLLNKMTSLT